LNFAWQTDHDFPLTIDFDRPTKPRIESDRHRKSVGRSTSGSHIFPCTA
jgi:hypothetical protein